MWVVFRLAFLFWIGGFWLMSVLEEGKAVRCHRTPNALCRVATAKDTGASSFCWISGQLLNHAMAASGFPGTKMESKQKLVCPNKNVQKLVMFPKVHAAIKKWTCGCLSAFGLQIPTQNLALLWSFRDTNILLPSNSFLLLFAGFLLI